ncbi:MAG: aldo/keto reductase [Propionicimonas sp.]|uniref:aldo/keto reductase n=1 Tax=Propionicimonas sp. TaxID=1955623 RepID=UPI003D13C5B0
MRYGSLGRSGLMVSAVGVGCNAFGARIGPEQVQAVVDAAIDAGITLFDTADSYGDGASEELLGRALGGRREDVIVATKFGMGDHTAEHFGAHGGRRYVRRAVEASLRRLGTDYIDLYQLHRPDPVTPIEETLEAMGELVAEGKVRYLGSSNFSAWQVVDADWVARTSGLHRFVSAQNEYSLYNPEAERELVPACDRVGVGILPYFPLAYGLLTGKYRRDEHAPEGSRLARDDHASRFAGADWDRLDALQSFADARGVPLLTLAVGGLAAREAVGSVICGVTRPEQVAANAAAGEWVPSAQDLAELDELRGKPAFSYTTFA